MTMSRLSHAAGLGESLSTRPGLVGRRPIIVALVPELYDSEVGLNLRLDGVGGGREWSATASVTPFAVTTVTLRSQ